MCMFVKPFEMLSILFDLPALDLPVKLNINCETNVADLSNAQTKYLLT